LGVSKEDLQAALAEFEPAFLTYYTAGMNKKMGLPDEHIDSFEIGMDFLRILQAEKLDYTNSFRLLIEKEHWRVLRDDCLNLHAFDQFIQRYQQATEQLEPTERLSLMQQHNPIYVLRNHMAQRAIEQAEQGDFSEVDRLFKLLSEPYTKQAELEKETDLGPLPSDEPEVSVSCSS
jgi:uncharacterized protein YdiU (UPF0061 family)